MAKQLPVQGMTCSHCETAIAEAISSVGAVPLEVRHAKGTALVDPAGVSEDVVRTAIKRAGYSTGPWLEVGGDTQAPAPEPSDGSSNIFDLVVIGSGSAAFGAAITASDAGRRVAVVEAHTVGGTCVNVGCVPSKALLAAATEHHRAGHHPFHGIATSPGAVDMGAVVEQKNGLVDTLRKEKYLDLAADYGFTIVHGRARLEPPATVVVGEQRIRAERVIIASGVEPSIPPIEGLTDMPYLTSTSALDLTVLPEHLIVIGANAIGLELGQAFLHLGAAVTFLEAAPTVAPLEEPEVVEVIAGVLADEGAVVRTGVTIRRVTRDGAGIAVELEMAGSAETVRGSHLLVATGRRPSFTGMGLEDVGVELDDRGFIRVDPELRTTAPGVLAAGDVAGVPQFVYVAARSGGLAARNAFAEQPESLDLTALPRIVFTTPQIAVAGMTDEEANRQGYTCECRVLPLDAVPRALVNHDTRGVVKIVADATTRRVLGVSIVADGAGDVILAAVYAIKFGITVEQLADTWGPYLTMGEALKLAAQTFTRDVSKLSCCAA